MRSESAPRHRSLNGTAPLSPPIHWPQWSDDVGDDDADADEGENENDDDDDDDEGGNEVDDGDGGEDADDGGGTLDDEADDEKIVLRLKGLADEVRILAVDRIPR